MIPLIVVEGAAAQWRQVIGDLSARGWEIVAGDAISAAPGTVIAASIATPADAHAAVIAAADGCGVVLHGAADREVLDRMCDDLRHLGSLDHRPDPHAVLLDDEQRAVLDALLTGASLAEAAAALHLSGRTLDRRLATLRAA